MNAHNVKGSEAIEYFGKYLYGPGFNVNDPNDPMRRRLYENLYYYFAKSSKSVLNINRSLVLRGDLGVGKTMCMRTLNMVFKAFKYTHAKRGIERIFKEYGEIEALDQFGYNYAGDLCIDDVGTEEEVTKVYTNKVYIIGQILLERSDLYQDAGFKTHIITNLTDPQLEARYGDRAFDRLKGSCEFITWQGDSNRKISEDL